MTAQPTAFATFHNHAGETLGAVPIERAGWNKIPPDIAIRFFPLANPEVVMSGEFIGIFRTRKDGTVQTSILPAAEAQDLLDRENGFETLVIRAAQAKLGGEARITVQADIVNG